MHCGLTLARIPFDLRSTPVDSSLSDGRKSDNSCSAVPLNSHSCVFHIVQRTNTPSSRSSQLRTQRTSHTLSLGAKRCTTLLCNKLNIVFCVKTYLRKVHHSDLSDQSDCNARIARSTCYEPNVGLDESGHLFMSMADGDDEDLNGN